MELDVIPLSEVQTKYQGFYPVDPPQEYDEFGQELGPDAQVWKTYVKEANRVDEEQVDAWNKSTDVILIFAALFSAISTAFVIESHKGLKQDSADASFKTLLNISLTLTAIANGSQPPTTQPLPSVQAEGTQIPVPRKTICVNVLWFLSLSLSVAVSLISMLAKEWCLTFMSGRNGPPGAQALRRQQRWNTMKWWKMEEVLMILPSLIHLSLLLFAIGLCIFLGDINTTVAIPVIFVITLVVFLYFLCSVLPFLSKYCPYGTMISTLIKRFGNGDQKLQVSQPTWAENKVKVQALAWIINYCETPRSIDVALQSVAGAPMDMPWDAIAESGICSMIAEKLGCKGIDLLGRHEDPGTALYSRAFQRIMAIRRVADNPGYGLNAKTKRIEYVTLGLQVCIDRFRSKIEDEAPSNVKRALGDILKSTSHLIYRVSTRPTHGLSEYQSHDPHTKINVDSTQEGEVDPLQLAQSITGCLERHLKGKVDLGPDGFTLLVAILAFLLSCRLSGSHSESGAIIKRVLQASHNKLKKFCLMSSLATYDSRKRDADMQLRYTNTRQFQQLAILPWVSTFAEIPSHPSSQSLNGEHGHMEPVISAIWQFLVGNSHYETNSGDTGVQYAYGIAHLVLNHKIYGLIDEDRTTLMDILSGSVIRTRGHNPKEEFTNSDSNTRLSAITNHYLPLFKDTDPDGFVTLMAKISSRYRLLSFEHQYLALTPEVYVFAVHRLCDATSDKQKQTLLELMSQCLFPKLTPHLAELLSTKGVVAALARNRNHKDIVIRTFALTQMWLLFGLASGSEDNKTNDACAMLEGALQPFTLPAQLGTCGEQGPGSVIDELEIQLKLLLADCDGALANTSKETVPRCDYHWHFSRYLFRVLEHIAQECGGALSQDANKWLQRLEKRTLTTYN